MTNPILHPIYYNNQTFYSVLDILSVVSNEFPVPYWNRLKANYPQAVFPEPSKSFVSLFSTIKRSKPVACAKTYIFEECVAHQSSKERKIPLIVVEDIAWLLDVIPEIVGKSYCISAAEAIAAFVGYEELVSIVSVNHYLDVEMDIQIDIDIQSCNERELSFKIAALLGRKVCAQAQVKCPTGIIDILTNDCLIELKLDKNDWKAALGQVLVYGLTYPKHEKEIWLLGSVEEIIVHASAYYGVTVRWFDSIQSILNTLEAST